MAELAHKSEALSMGTKATISISAGPEGLNIGVDLHGDNMTSNPTAVQCLAMVGVDAIREAIREQFNVTSEKVEPLQKQPKTH